MLYKENSYGQHWQCAVIIARIGFVFWPARTLMLSAGSFVCSNCSASSCVAGQHLSGCGGASAGTCASCPAGSFSISSGACLSFLIMNFFMHYPSHCDACWQSYGAPTSSVMCSSAAQVISPGVVIWFESIIEDYVLPVILECRFEYG